MKRLIQTLFLFVCLLSVANAQVAFDAASNPSAVNDNELTYSHTNTGSDLCLLVAINKNDSDTGSAVTYNTVSMNFEVRFVIGQGDSVEIWSLGNPATGANNVAITTTNVVDIISGAVSFTNADTADCVSNTSSTEATSDAPSLAVTSVSGEFVLGAMVIDTTVTVTPGTGETERWETVGSSGLVGWGATEPSTGSSVTIAPSLSGSAAWGMVNASVKEAVGAPAARRVVVVN